MWQSIKTLRFLKFTTRGKVSPLNWRKHPSLFYWHGKHILTNKRLLTPKSLGFFNSFLNHHGQALPVTQRKYHASFLEENHGFKPLIFIPAASHSASKHSDACRRSGSGGVGKNGSDVTSITPTHWTPLRYQQCLDILSMKNTNRNENKTHPWQVHPSKANTSRTDTGSHLDTIPRTPAVTSNNKRRTARSNTFSRFTSQD